MIYGGDNAIIDIAVLDTDGDAVNHLDIATVAVSIKVRGETDPVEEGEASWNEARSTWEYVWVTPVVADDRFYTATVSVTSASDSSGIEKSHFRVARPS